MEGFTADSHWPIRDKHCKEVGRNKELSEEDKSRIPCSLIRIRKLSELTGGLVIDQEHGG